MRARPEGRGPLVAIDLHAVDTGYQGIRSHVLELFPRVVEACPEISFALLVAEPDRFLAEHPAFDRPNARALAMPLVDPVRRLAWQLPALVRRLGADVLHTQFVAPLASRAADVVTVHDVLFESHPEHFPARFRWRSRALVRRSARRAAQVLTVSEFSRRELVARWGLDPARVSVARNGVDLERFRPGPGGEESVRALGLEPGAYALTVGRLDPRKNHLGLLDAWERLGPAAPPLAIVCPRGPLARELARRCDRSRARLLHDVDDDDLPAVYRHAALFAFPSFAEGFGLPVLEAQASGVPVVTSCTTALPEVAGDAALLVDPHDPAAIATAVRRVLDEPALRARLSTAGPTHAARFRWEAAAETVAAAYRCALTVAESTAAA